MAIRYNCQRTCNSCRTQEIIDLDASTAAGLSREAGSPNGEGAREADTSGSPDDAGASDRSAMVVTAVLVAVLAVAALGAAYLLNSQRMSYRFETADSVAELGWDNSAETAWENRRATVWGQAGSVDGSHFYPEVHEGGMVFAPVNLGNSLGQAPPAPLRPIGPDMFYPLSARLGR